MLDTKTIAEVLNTTERRVKDAVKALNIDGSIGKGNKRYYGSVDIDRIKSHIAK